MNNPGLDRERLKNGERLIATVFLVSTTIPTDKKNLYIRYLMLLTGEEALDVRFQGYFRWNRI